MSGPLAGSHPMAGSGPLAGLGVLLRKELLEQWRTARLPVVAVVFALVGLASPLLARFTPELLASFGGGITVSLPTPTAADAWGQFDKNVGQLGALVAILLAMGAVASERERGTAALILTRPAGRAAFLVAKLVAIAVTLAVAEALAGAGAWFYTLVLFQALPPAAFAAAIGCQWLGLVAFAAITLLASTIAPSPAAAAGLGIVALVGIGVVSFLPALGPYLPTGLGAPARALALGLPGGGPGDLALPLAATLAWIAAVTLVAWLLFRRQEL